MNCIERHRRDYGGTCARMPLHRYMVHMLLAESGPLRWYGWPGGVCE